MRESFAGSMIAVAVCRGRGRHFNVDHADVGSGSSPGAENALGRTRSTGNLDRRKRHAVAAARQVCRPGIFHRGAASRIG
jgi:hypothetical protein